MSSPTDRPLLSASLIVKDEEAMLPRCLAALEGVVDEIVVLDTGSTDRTVEIAEAAGAIVHHSGWHDDFARARNESLAHCSGRWVIYVDADEELMVGDVAAFRKSLARSAADAFTVRIDNVEDHGGSIAFTHDPVRLFRRSRFTFEGRVHEHVVARKRGAVVSPGDGLSIVHYGYVPDVVASKDKVSRNARLAQAAWEADPDNLLARVELARSLSSTRRHDETMAHLVALRAHGGAVRNTALTLGVKVLLNAGDLEQAVEWAEEIRRDGTSTVQSAKQHGEVLWKLGRHEEALAVLEEASELRGEGGVHGTHETLAAGQILRGRVLQVLGREEEAADLYVAIAADAPVSVWPLLMEILRRRGQLARAVQPFFDGLALLGDTRPRGVLAELSKAPVELGDALSEVLATRPDGLRFALAFIITNAERLPLERAVAWSAVAREAGLQDSCALVRQMDAFALPPMQRLMAATTVLGTFHDERGREAIERAAAELDDDEVPEALFIVSELAPDTLMELVTGYVTSQRKALVMADALVALGAHAEAVVVLHHGLEGCAPDPFSLDTITETLAQLEAPA